MIKSFFFLLVLLAGCASRGASDAPSGFLGKADCRIAPLEPRPVADAVSWSGACKDGFADGPGILSWRTVDKNDKLREDRKIEGMLTRGEVGGEAMLTVGHVSYVYIGTLRHGLPHGVGYARTPDGASYAGEWRDGQREGVGRANFALGGSYEGDWKDDKMEGQGTMVYAGSGRSYQGPFRDNRPVNRAARETVRGNYPIAVDLPSASRRGVSSAVEVLPPDLSWEKLTPAQQNLVRSWYAALEEGDDPPYPINGPGNFHRITIAVRDFLRQDVTGKVRLNVLVGVDGLAKSALIVGSPPAELGQYLAKAAMAQEFKPAVCHGTPCEMVYALEYVFSSKR